MSAATENLEHSARTQRSQYRYLFYAKHHGGDVKAAMWLPEITREVEFSVFDLADLHQIADERGWLYGVLLDNEGDLREIGKSEEQVAEFQPGNAVEEPWHGYPKWPVGKSGPPNRRKQRSRPQPVVFDLMFAAELITKVQLKQLLAGRQA